MIPLPFPDATPHGREINFEFTEIANVTSIPAA
jgi:hypothetical protein